MKNTDQDPFDPASSAPDEQGLDAALGAARLREVREEARMLREEIRRAGVPAAEAGPVRESVARALGTSKKIVAELDRAYIAAHERRDQQQAEAARRAAALDRFFRSLTYAGAPPELPPRTWSFMGWLENNPAWPLAFSRDRGHVMLCAGVPGSGKTVFSSLLCEGSLEADWPLTSQQLHPTSYAFFHLEEQDRLPQLLDGLKPNPVRADLEVLAERLGVHGLGLRRLRLAVPESLLPRLMPRLLPYFDLELEVVPLKVQLAQLGQPGLEAALGAEGGARYVQRMLEDAQRQGKDLELSRMRRFIDEADDLTAPMKRAAHARLDVLSEVASAPGGPGLWELFEPGVATVVYLGGPYAGRGRVLPLLVGLLNGLMLPSEKHGPFQRTIVVDEVNLLDRDEVAWRAFTRLSRMVRHLGSTLVLMGQDLLCVPDELFGLAGLVAVFKLQNPRIWEHIRERAGVMRGWTFEDVQRLRVAEAILGAVQTTDPRWQGEGRIVRWRPLRCQHGGQTRAVL